MRVALPFGIGTPENKRESYRAALRAVGLEPVENMEDLAGVKGLLLAGGTDVDPSLYGETRHENTDSSDTVRDQFEMKLLHEALEEDMPVFGICRGLQLMNVALGGTLIQHIDGHKQPKVREAHAVTIEAGSRLASILGAGKYMVNSRHHQAAAKVPESLAVTARDLDEVIEAVEAPSHRFVLAVQWHPEARMDGADAKLFQAFAAAVRRTS